MRDERMCEKTMCNARGERVHVMVDETKVVKDTSRDRFGLANIKGVEERRT